MITECLSLIAATCVMGAGALVIASNRAPDGKTKLMVRNVAGVLFAFGILTGLIIAGAS